mmetsp:Transcript_40408/g.114754  ORF Transcript_40408/g.114754 Transcript_40408/m.114754 type:complete len:293 (+) Transcript_40408:142-1020(+)
MGDEASKLSYHVDETRRFSTPARLDSRVLSGGISPLTPSPLSHASGDRFARRNVFLFDWDDTLLCSSALRLAPPSMDVLRQIEAAAESLLLTAMSMGETLIVTNGTESWVPDSAARFLPGLLRTLSNVTTVSARSRYEHLHPEDPFAWKREAFRDLLSEQKYEESSPASLLSDYGASDMNLIVIGDSWYEMEAARSTLSLPCAPACVKTVKFKEAPTVLELLGQLAKAERELANLVLEGESVNRTFVRRTLPSHLDHLVSQAPGWRFSNKEEESSWSLPGALGLKDLWPLFS